ncbi:TetR/AcrR family transcriptional regulator [Streptomyces sp. 5-10]|uniref:TetR/AcrR family transcriptional regulator n=1 Tax=Streptomyces sp. 5-10 TaxID=878925 RepID=UPI00168A8AB6|nr:TetR/AcrR family transcriptional regulator [Streptomyces sp. 5-10]MBD3008970.1 TetR/AcrR family transcriptional regulator [Streptomyces sp. 5-10]
MASAPEPVRPGRKRSEDSRTAILAAAWELTVELGYPGLTVQGIAARAGTGKQTVYRWWPSKADVLLEALVLKADVQIGLDDHGSYAADLRQFLDRSFALALEPSIMRVMRTLMAQAQIDPEFGACFREQFLARRRAAFEVLADRAVERGDFPAGRSPALDARIVFGLLWYDVLAEPPPLGAHPTGEPHQVLVDALINLLTHSPVREGPA